ncbi:MAG: hypothetical protein HOV83_36855 [Catenulispora sp.]|nr:hypothetical protein [Catenulispora sp.]
MIGWLCAGLLDTTARRWPPAVRDELRAEWQAELAAATGPWQRLRFAASLAATGPEGPQTFSPVRVGAAALGSLLIIGGLPIAYFRFALAWVSYASDDTIGWQAWVGVASLLVAVGLGYLGARLTASLTRFVTPWFAALWTFGLVLLLWIGDELRRGWLIRADVIDWSLWALGATVFVSASILLAQRGSRVLSRAAAVVAVPVALAGFVHGGIGGYDLLFDSRLAAFAFALGTSMLVHVTVFLVAYSRTLGVRAAGQASSGRLSSSTPA